MLMRCVFDGTKSTMVPMTPEEEAAQLAEWEANAAVVARPYTVEQKLLSLGISMADLKAALAK
jgi:hypothetical protein